MARYIDADNLKLPFASYLQRGRLEKDEEVYWGYFYNWRIDGTEIKEAINREPTADVRENVRGEWIYGEEGTFGNPYGHYKCSVCREIRPWRENFCPDCGADMRGDNNE